MNEQSVAKLLKDLDKELSEIRVSLPARPATSGASVIRYSGISCLREEKPRLLVDTALLDRLRDATGRFEVTHPNLTAGMAQVIDSLTNLGI